MMVSEPVPRRRRGPTGEPAGGPRRTRRRGRTAMSGGRLGTDAARVAGLSQLAAPTLAGIERRRLHLWIAATVLLVALVAALAC